MTGLGLGLGGLGTKGLGLGLDNLEIPGNSQIDDVLTDYGGLLHVLPLAVHLRFFCWPWPFAVPALSLRTWIWLTSDLKPYLLLNWCRTFTGPSFRRHLTPKNVFVKLKQIIYRLKKKTKFQVIDWIFHLILDLFNQNKLKANNPFLQNNGCLSIKSFMNIFFLHFWMIQTMFKNK